MDIRPTIRRITRGQFVLLTLVFATAVYVLGGWGSNVYYDYQADIRVAQEAGIDFNPADYTIPGPGQVAPKQRAPRMNAEATAINTRANASRAAFLAVIVLLVAGWVVIAWVWLGRKAASS